MDGYDRTALLGIRMTSIGLEGGHALTRREHKCGEFVDTFDWKSLPAAYLRRIGKD